MRPLKLTMTAFGPYAGEQVIDFTKLEGRKLFVITGPTGAGKTTIFDGICYALYGEASGQERDGQSLRSDFAEVGTLTSVELEFELRGKKYWIQRVPSQMRPRVRGEGMREHGAEAYFKESADESVTVSKIQDVDTKIVETLGITVEQFRQIIMVPQGEFRKLITTDVREREDILRRIFGTQAFEMIQKKLLQKSKDLEQLINNEKLLLNQSVERIDSSASPELSAILTSPPYNLPAIVSELVKAIEQDTVGEKSVLDSIGDKTGAVTNKQAELNLAGEIQQKIFIRNEAEKTKNTLELKQDEFSGKEKILQQARKAEGLKGIEDNCRTEETRVKSLREKLQIAEKGEERCAEDFQTADKALQGEKDREEERNGLLAEQAKLQGLKDKIGELESKKSELVAQEDNFAKIGKELSESQKGLATEKDNLATIQNELEQAKAAELQYARQSSEWTRASSAWDTLKKMKNANDGRTLLRQKETEAETQFLKVREEREKAEHEHTRCNDEFIKGQAGELASLLQEGEPCAVCGSLSHPKPAAKSPSMSSQADLKILGEKLKNARDAESASRSSLEKAIANVQAQEKIIDTLRDGLEPSLKEVAASLCADRFGAWVTESMREWKTQTDQLGRTLLELAEKKKRIPEWENKKTAANKNIEELNQSIVRLQNVFSEAVTKIEVNKEVVSRLETELPPEIRSQQTFADALDSVQKNYKKLKDALDKVVKEFNDSRENHVKAAAAKEAAQNTLKDAVLAMEEIRAGYQTAITEGGFADESEYLSAKRSKEQIAQMEKEIAKYQQELVAAKALYQKAAQDAEGLVPVDLTPLQQELEGLQREIGALNDRRSLLYNRRDRNGEILKYIQARKIALDRKEEQYSEINELNKVANGNNEQRISFERYVLAAFFQDVIAAANLRLDKMTGGRYEMRRIGERRRGGGQSGLELEVMDYYTGQARHVKTLSGGEGFKASLALALGLADVVQSYAGGVSLETMFVDEGFGTLDPESLDSAIDCLVDLQHSGRLVGIISHVPELKDKVDARLEVQAGKTGSVAQFVVG